MTEVASLGVALKTEQIDKGTASLTAFTQGASAAERAAQKLGTSTDSVGSSSEQFTARVRRTIEAQQFYAQQLARTSAEQERYRTIRQAGASAESAAGAAISESVRKLQEQRAAQQAATEAARQATEAARAAQQAAVESARIAQQQIDNVKRVSDGLEYERAQLGRTATERAQYDALKRAGISAGSAEGKTIMATVASLELEREALRKTELARLSAGKAATTSLTAQQKLILGYQFNDIFTQLAGGTNPALIAAQQGPQITQIFGGLKNTIAAIPVPALVAIGAAIAGIAGAATLNAIAKLNDELAEQQRRLTTLLGSQTDAARAYGDIAKFASDAGIGLDAATASFVAFGRASQGLGATRQNIADIAIVAEKLTQLSGASKEEGGAAQGALANMLKGATVDADQLKTVLGNVPQIADRIASGLGVSVTQLRLMAAAGELSNRQVFDALLKQSNAVNTEFARMPKSIGSQFQSLADDMLQVVQRFANLVPLVQQYRVAIDLAARGAKALNEATTPATPTQRMQAAGGPSVYNDASNRIYRRGANPSEFYGAQFDQGVADNQATFAEMQGQSKAANENIVNAMSLADKLDPLGKQFRDSQKNIDDMEKGLADLQSSLKGVTTDEAVRQMGALENAINRAKTAAGNVSPALKALNDIYLRNDARSNGGTQADVDLQTQIQQFKAGGDNEQNATTAALALQQEKITDIIKAKQQEADAEEKITAATGKGKQALIEAQVEAAKLAFIMANVGKNTEVSAEAITAYGTAVRTVLQQQAAQQSIDASKPLLVELEGIIAAQALATSGAYAMAEAMAQVAAAHDENGTGALQMQAFQARQILADTQNIVALKLQADLTNKLAAAAGDVAKQKQIQLDHEIAIAKAAAHPAMRPAIEEQMRGKAAADNELAYANIIAQSREYVASQKVEQDALFMSAQGADRLRFEHDLLNQAKQAGIALTPSVVEGLGREAAAMAEAKARTDDLRQITDASRQAFAGFFADVNQGLRDGASVWDIFANAGVNALDRISSKLIDMAANKLFDAALGGSSSGGGGGLFGSIVGWVGSLLGGGMSSGASGVGSGLTTVGGVVNANGNAFDRGNVVPFARGDVFSSPTTFPMAGGRTGLMAEAGPEAIMPLTRGRNGKLGVQMTGGGRANDNAAPTIVNQTLNIQVGSFATRAEMLTMGQMIKREARDGAVAAVVDLRKRGDKSMRS